MNPLPSEEEILRNLESESVEIRRQAVLDCMESGLLTCIPKLRVRLREDQDPGVRSVSALALGDFRDTSSLSEILSLKKSPEIFPETIVDAISRMGDTRGCPTLVGYLVSPNHTLRLLAVDGLEKCKCRGSGSEILKLAQTHPDKNLEKTFAMALGRVEYKPSENYLLRLLKDEEDGPSKAAAILALGKIQSQKASLPIMEILQSDYPKGKENAFQALKTIKDFRIFSNLIPILSSPDRETRFLAAGIIVELRSEPNLKKIRSELEKANEKNLAPLVKILGEWKDEESRVKIETLLGNRNSPDREILAEALGWIGNPKSQKLLWSVLKEESGEARYSAAWALGFAGREESVPHLIQASRSSDQKLALMALESLGHLKSTEAIPRLSEAARNESLAPFAISSLNQIPGPKIRVELENLATSNSEVIAKLAIHALGERKDPNSLPVLEDLAKSKSPEIRKAARFAIKSIRPQSSPN
jgi:HEAT repeat protein